MLNLKKIEVIALGVLFVISSPSFVSAQTVADLQAQIQALLDQIANLQQQIGGMTDPAPAPESTTPALSFTCPKLTRDLYVGLRGEDVAQLQRFLAQYFELDAADIASGYFGQTTRGLVVRFQKEKGVAALGGVGAGTRAIIARMCNNVPPPPLPAGGISVTSPNGGEQWESGMLNTVTWTPYSYGPDVNPARDVTAYLETMDRSGNFTTLGKVQESGKASIHWITGELDSATQGGKFADPNRLYYIRVVNNVTGASDRSDAPFTLLPKPVDLKLNGSDGPILNPAGQAVTATWRANGSSVTGCEIHNGYTDTTYQTQVGSVTLSGSRSLYAYPQPNHYVTLYCTLANGGSISDSVQVNPQAAPATIQVTSPNGGESVALNQLSRIEWNQTGLKSVSVALYKNDQWYKWLEKDMNTQGGDGKNGIDWIPSSSFLAMSSDNDVASLGAVWKMYVTGQKTDGTGYIDDKSDSSFSFTTSGAGAFPMALNKTNYAVGEKIVVTWGGYAGAAKQDWVAVVAAGKKYTAATWPGGNVVAPWVYTNASAQGPVTIVAPKTVGTYEVVYYAKNGFTEVARSMPFTIGAFIPSTTGTLQLAYKGNVFSSIPNLSKSIAQALCGFGGADQPCSWNGENIPNAAIYGKDGDPTIKFARPYVDQNETITIGSEYVIKFQDEGNSTFSPSTYRVYLAKFASGGALEAMYEANIRSINRDRTNVNLTWDFTTNAGRVPAGMYYIYAVNTETSVSGSVGNYTFLVGSSTPSTAGALTIATDPSTPSYQLAAGGTSNVTLSAFKFRATGENIRLEKVGLILGTDTAYPGDLTQVALYAGNTQIGTAIFPGNSNTTDVFLSQPLNLPRDTDTVITVKGDIAMIGAGQSGRSGDLIKVMSTSARGTGVTSGGAISVGQLNSGPETIPGVRIFRSFPMVSLETLPNDGLADGRLIRFKVSAASGGDIGIAQLGFTIVQDSPLTSVTEASLYAYTDAGYSSPINSAGGLLGTSVVQGSGAYTRIAIGPLQVPAGGVRYFELRGKGTLSGTVVTTLPGSAGSQGLAPTSGFLDNFVWSPNSTKMSAITDADWTNAYGVGVIHPNGITKTRTGGTQPPTTNTALPILTSARTVEQQYLAAVKATEALLLTKSCDASTAMLATVRAKITSSESALTSIGALITSLGSTPSLETQRTTLQQYDALVASRSAHTQIDVTTVQSETTSVQSQLSTLCAAPVSASVTTNASSYTSGATMTASWSYSATGLAKDWIGLANVNSAWTTAFPTENQGWFWTGGAASGSKTLKVPTTPGSYQVVYYRSSTGNVSASTEVARSSTFTVATVSNTATYRAYLNNSSTPNIMTQDVSETYALDNCKLNAANNPQSSIRCTWGEKEIYSAAGTPIPPTASTTTMYQAQGRPGSCGWSTSPTYCSTSTFDSNCWQNIRTIGTCTQGVNCPTGVQIGACKAPNVSSERTAQLANTLSALESIVKDLIKRIGSL